MSRLTGVQQLPLDCDVSELQAGDLIHVETPLNPTGEARNLQFYADKARQAGAYLSVDATLAPPPLQNPFDLGADVVMHSGTKYFGGHSDMLCGVLALHPEHKKWFGPLFWDRLHIGSVMGSFEGWLGMRSIRTLELRVVRQSINAVSLVAWLASELKGAKSGVSSTIDSIHHSSLQGEASEDGSWLQKQMPGGHAPVFAIVMKDQELARRLPSKLRLFHHATSLGGVESLIEWRLMSDSDVDPRLLRVSIGVEGFDDLKEDLRQAFEQLQKEAGTSTSEKEK